TPEGSFFAWLPVPSNYTSEEFADLLLERAHVVVAPGRGVGKYGDGYVRVGLLESADRLEEAAARIGRLGIFEGGIRLTNVIDLQSVSWRRQQENILSDINWCVEKGEHWAILGLNGS